MRKVFVLLLMFFASLNTIRACEICGCGVGNYYIGLLPQFNHHFIGLRYHYNKFKTRLVNDPTQFSNDLYQTLELWGGWNIGKRFQVLAIVPYNINHQTSDEGVTKLNGIGDAMALVNYKLLDVNSKTGNHGNVSQQLWIGAGLKFSTGKFDIDVNDPDIASSANVQLGSGSTDVLLSSMYNVRVNKVGINTSATYKINSTNKDDYRFGNKLSIGSIIYYSINSSVVTISPNAGLQYERTEGSELTGSKIDLTGGSLLQGSFGAEASFKKIAVGFNMQLPIAQNFAEDQTHQKVKGMVHVSFAF